MPDAGNVVQCGQEPWSGIFAIALLWDHSRHLFFLLRFPGTIPKAVFARVCPAHTSRDKIFMRSPVQVFFSRQNFPGKGQTVNTLAFQGTRSLWQRLNSALVAPTNEQACVSIKLY